MKDDTTARTKPKSPLDHDPAKLRRKRFEAGLSQAVLAEKASCSSGHVSELEAGTRNPSPQLLARIAQGLGCSPADLMPDAPRSAAR